MPGSVLRCFTRPKTITHPETNLARCRVTTLIKTNVLPLSQTGRYVGKKWVIWPAALGGRHVQVAEHYFTQHRVRIVCQDVKPNVTSTYILQWKCEAISVLPYCPLRSTKSPRRRRSVIRAGYRHVPATSTSVYMHSTALETDSDERTRYQQVAS